MFLLSFGYIEKKYEDDIYISATHKHLWAKNRKAPPPPRGSLDQLESHISNLKEHIRKLTQKRIVRGGRDPPIVQRREKAKKLAQLNKELKALETQHTSMMGAESSSLLASKRENIENRARKCNFTGNANKYSQAKTRNYKIIKRSTAKKRSELGLSRTSTSKNDT